MKLIFCPECQDVVKLRVEHYRYCWCCKSGGQYAKDGLHAIIYGLAIPIGFANMSFHKAIKQQDNHESTTFRAFIIEKKCKTIEKRKEFNYEYHKNYCSRK